MRLMNAFGDAASHTILSAVPDALGARDAIDPAIAVDFPGNAAPALHGKPGVARYRVLARYMSGFDLVLTYNWGALDALGARRLFPSGCPPLIHHEDGFNEREAHGTLFKRNVFRRFVFPAARHLVVPSTTLEEVATGTWKRRAPQLVRIPNGIAVDGYLTPRPDGIPGLERQDGEVVVGTLAGLRAVKNLPRLVRAFAAVADRARLVIVGEGPERDAICAEAAKLGFADRLLLPGFIPDPHLYAGLFDIFALSSDSEQFPISLVEAMAAGLPAVATAVGDVAAMVSAENRPFIVNRDDEIALAAVLAKLVDDRELRKRLGCANRAKAVAEYDEGAMIAAYASLYGIVTYSI